MPGKESTSSGGPRKSFSKGPRSKGRSSDGGRPKRKGFIRKKVNRFLTVYPQNTTVVDYKDVDKLSRFVTEKGKIIPRRTSGITAKQQRILVRAIKRARHAGLLGFKIV